MGKLEPEQAQVAALFAPYPHIRLATQADEATLSALHRSIPMESGPVGLAYDYGDGPAKAALEAGHTFTSVFEAAGQLQGTATLSSRQMRLGADRISCGYVANLRILPRPASVIRREWRRFYGALVQAAPTLGAAHRPVFITTAVLQDNAMAVKFLTHHLKEVRYLALQDYTAITAFAPLPFARRSLEGIGLRMATQADLPRIRAFLAGCVERRGVGEDFTRDGDDELTRRLRDWHDFKITDFVLAEDADGALRATVAPRLTPHRSIRLTRAGLLTRLLLRLKRIRTPGAIKVLYLTHFEHRDDLDVPSREALVEAMLSFVWRKIAKPLGAHALCFPAWPQFGWPARVRGWAQLTTRGTLYQVVPASAEGSTALRQAALRGPLPLELSTS